MIAIISLLTIVTFSFLVVRTGTVALMMTGLSRDVAKFQALSAFSGTGFTTRESESVMNHPARRHVIRILVLLGNMGVVSAISTAILSFVGVDDRSLLSQRFLILLAGLIVLWWIARSKILEEKMSFVFEKLLAAFTDLELQDYHSLLRLDKEYSVAEIHVEPNSWLAHCPIGCLGLDDEGLTVLGIVREENNEYLGAPPSGVTLKPGDILVLYGRTERLREIAERNAGLQGDQAHHDAAAEHEKRIQEIETQSEASP